MGFVTDLTHATSFIYKAPFDNGLTEHELDHIMLGNYIGDPLINRDEVAAWKWMAVEDVKADIKANPDQYTVWFKIIFDKFYSFIRL